MIKKSLRLKTIVGVATIEAVLLLSLILMMLGYIRDTNYQALETRAETLSKLFATTTKDAVLAYDLASLDSFVQELMTNKGIAYTRVIGRSGEVLASSKGAEILHPQLDESIEEVNDQIYDTSAVISEGDAVFGRVEVGFEIDAIIAIIDQAKRWSVGIAALEMVLVALFSFMLGRFLTDKLTELRSATERISQGDLGVQIEVKGEDEIDEVSTAFNQMSRSLLESQKQMNQLGLELQHLNETLEDKVRTRTSELQQRNQELADANHSIKNAQDRLLQTEKSAMVGVLTAGVAHEINNPLGFVTSNVRALSNYIENYEELTDELIESERGQQLLTADQLEKLLEKTDYEFMREDIQQLLAETNAGLKRVSNIVEKLGALRDGQVTSSLQPVDLAAVITSVVEQIRKTHWPEVNFAIELDETPKVRSAAQVLSDVLNGVIENACLACQGQGEVRIYAVIGDTHLSLVIEDTGDGVPEENRSKIFDPFFTTRDVGGGIGLGLYRVKMLLDALEGAIDLDHSYTEGARFNIALPLSDETEAI